MQDLETKLYSEMLENSIIIACRFPLPNKRPIESFGWGIDTVWVYDLSNKNNIIPKYTISLKTGKFY